MYEIKIKNSHKGPFDLQFHQLLIDSTSRTLRALKRHYPGMFDRAYVLGDVVLVSTVQHEYIVDDLIMYFCSIVNKLNKDANIITVDIDWIEDSELNFDSYIQATKELFNTLEHDPELFSQPTFEDLPEALRKGTWLTI